MDKKQKMVPKLRFPGFNDDWEQRKLIEISDIITGTTPPTKDKHNYGGGRLFVSPADIQGNRYVDETITTLTEKGYALGRELRAGTTLFVSIGSTIGKVAQIKETATTNQQINAVVPNDEMDDNFVFTMLENEADKIKKLAATQAVPIINKTTFGETEIQFPKKEEQTRIGKYFSNLDNLITLHQRKLDQMKNYKQGLLQKMFPKNGEHIPEIRFPGFTDAWEQRKFGDVGSVAMCKRIFKEQTSEEGDVPFYKIGTFGGTPDAYISRELFEEYKKTYQYPSKGDILISASGSIGRTVEYTGKDEYFQDSNIVWLKHGNNIDNAFLKVLYSVVEWSCEGSTIKRLYNDNFLRTEFMLPHIEEQIKIGKFFGQMDNLITLHQRKLDQMKEYKKGLLQQMFV